MIVYRIEDAAGGGPYRGDTMLPVGMLFDSHIVDGSPNPFLTHPTPVDDVAGWKSVEIFGMRERQSPFKFGFSSMDQLKDWFGPAARRLLREKNFQIVVYEVDDNDVMPGSKQVAFRAATARKLHTEPIANS